MRSLESTFQRVYVQRPAKYSHDCDTIDEVTAAGHILHDASNFQSLYIQVRARFKLQNSLIKKKKKVTDVSSSKNVGSTLSLFFNITIKEMVLAIIFENS